VPSPPSPAWRIDRNADADNGDGDRDRDQRHDEKLLTPLSTRKAPRPTHHGTSRGCAALAGRFVGNSMLISVRCHSLERDRARFGMGAPLSGRPLARRAGTPRDRPRRQLGVVRDDYRRDTAMTGGENHPHDALTVHRIQRT